MWREWITCWPAAWLYRWLPPEIRSVCDADALRWTEDQDAPWARLPPPRLFLYVFANYLEFRNVVRHRLRYRGGLWLRAVERVFRWFYYGEHSLLLRTADIGPGLRIQHGVAAVIYAQRIGARAWINQQVTIGHTRANAAPVIGDNVRVFAGAKVFGAITVGDNALIGANAVVTKNVPPDCTVAGVPARIIRRKGVRCDEAL